MQTKHLCDLIHILTKGEVCAPWNQLSQPVKYFYWPFQGGASFVGHVFLYFCSRLFIDALSSPVGKGLTPWLSFMMSNCEVVTFPLVSWVRCGAWLYRFLIFALFLTLPAGKGLTSWLSFVVSSVSLSLSHWYPGSGVVLDCIDSWSLQPYLL